MILYTMTDEQIAKELETDLRWIKENAKKAAKKKLLKRISLGIASIDHVEDYELQTPNGNLWAITANLRFTKKRDIRIRACCVVESDYGTKDYLILRGTRWGGTFYVKVISHVISRMKERNKKYAGMTGGQVANRIFQPGESGHGAMRDAWALDDDFLGLPDGEDIQSMIVTSAGVFFGSHNRDKDKGICNTKLITFVPPEKMATYAQADTYRFLETCLQMDKLICYTKTIGTNAISYYEESPEFDRIKSILDEYKTDPLSAKGTFEIPE